MADAVWNNLKRMNPEAQRLGESWWKPGEPGFTPCITRIFSEKPDFIIVATGGSGMVNFRIIFRGLCAAQ
jgi:branched-chain amino acid transport system substrate-binding protein